ncbi:MAG: ribonuclease III family protein [Candidatus Heimdallarchaeota archaeon]|nr:ribonuclease III family protein [Candidatus Heimdallarchaeota archaeon]
MKNQLMEYFQLSKDKAIFFQAIQPKSCGGGDTFKYLALYGDSVLNLILLDIISNKEIANSGQITEIIQSFHNEKTLTQIAKQLKIDKIMKEEFGNEKPTQNDLKECIEALLGGTYKTGGLISSKKVVLKLLQLSNTNNLFTPNPKGFLQILFQKKNFMIPKYITTRIGGPDHLQEFQCVLKGEFNGKLYEIKSNIHHNKQNAEKEAATKFLKEIGENESLKNFWFDT